MFSDVKPSDEAKVVGTHVGVECVCFGGLYRKERDSMYGHHMQICENVTSFDATGQYKKNIKHQNNGFHS